MMTKKPLRVGLTGGIGSGKTTVANYFKTLGVPVVDTDLISKELTKETSGKALPFIRQAFGDTLFNADQSLARDKLRVRIFQSQKDKKMLESIMHPLIFEEAIKQIESHALTHPVIIIDIPLLAESQLWRNHLDQILVIDCDEAIQLQRIIARSGWSLDVAQAAINNQASRHARLAIATHAIDNSHITLNELYLKVDQLYQQWQQSKTSKTP